MSINPYDILGISPGASEQEIKKAYKKLAKQHHPDLNGGDKACEAKFKEINEAYSMLTDKRESHTNSGQGGPFPFDIHEFFNETIFDHIFRGGSARTINRIRVDPRVLIRGGSFDYTVQLVENRGGRLHPVNRTIQVNVEANTPVLAQVMVPGSQQVFLQLIPGDTDIYRVTDMIHLTENCRIPAILAMVGGEVEVTVPDGKKMKFSIAAGTQNGAIHRLRGLGMRLPDGRHGDYNVQFVVVVPAITGEGWEEELKKQIQEALRLKS